TEARREPGRVLLWRALREDRRPRQARALDGQRDARAAPGQLLGDECGHDARAIAVRLLQELGPVEPHLSVLLDDRPGKLFLLVVLVGHRADFLLREAVDPVPDLLLLVAQLERNHVCPRAPGVLTHQYSYVPFPDTDATPRRVSVSIALTRWGGGSDRLDPQPVGAGDEERPPHAGQDRAGHLHGHQRPDHRPHHPPTPHPQGRPDEHVAPPQAGQAAPDPARPDGDPRGPLSTLARR